MGFGIGSILGLASGALGLLGKGEEKTATQESRPYLPTAYQQGYDTLLADFLSKVYPRTYRAPLLRRAEAGDSPELLRRQAMIDEMMAQPVAPTPSAPGIDADTLKLAMDAATGRAMAMSASGTPYNLGNPYVNSMTGGSSLTPMTDADAALLARIGPTFGRAAPTSVGKDALKGIDVNSMTTPNLRNIALALQGL
jgi:hypothetical protein